MFFFCYKASLSSFTVKLECYRICLSIYFSWGDWQNIIFMLITYSSLSPLFFVIFAIFFELTRRFLKIRVAGEFYPDPDLTFEKKPESDPTLENEPDSDPFNTAKRFFMDFKSWWWVRNRIYPNIEKPYLASTVFRKPDPDPDENTPLYNKMFLLHTECPKIYRKSVLHLLKLRSPEYLSRCSTDLR